MTVGDYKSEVSIYLIPEVMYFSKSWQRHFALHEEASNKINCSEVYALRSNPFST